MDAYKCLAVKHINFKSFAHSLDTYFHLILNALFSDNKNKGSFLIENVIKGRRVPKWPKLVGNYQVLRPGSISALC